MMTPCKKLYYAVEAVLYIAYYSDGNHPISSRDIARQQGLPSRHLEQIMQRLVHGNILRGMRGPRGGYRLARPADHVSIGEICNAVNEDDLITSMSPTTVLGEKVIRPYWEMLHNSVKDRLHVISIADLCEQANRHNISKKIPLKLDSVQ